MIEFLQAYGSWILFGLFFLLMMRMHGSHGGMGCGMGGHDHGSHDETPTEKREGQSEEPTAQERKLPLETGDRRRWLETVAAERMRRLADITREHGRPWWQKWAPSPAELADV